MSEQTAEHPAKRAKSSCPNSARDKLPSILTELNGGDVLDLTAMAAIKAVGSGDSTSDNPHIETLQSSINKLFADHAGKSPEIVLGNAIRHAKDELGREIAIFNKSQNGSYFGNEKDKWLNHPQNSYIKGPNPDGKVWIRLFLGEERAEELLGGAMPMNPQDGHQRDLEDCKSKEILESLIYRLLRQDASRLSTVDLLANILQYTMKEASKVSMNDLLRFSVLYGLDGVMNDVLRGRYGDTGEQALSVNTLLPLDDQPLPDDPSSLMLRDRKLFMPPYAFACILGHTNVVVAALAQPGGKMDTSFGFQFKTDEEEVESIDNHSLPSNCLVNDCGFQLQLIDHELTACSVVISKVFLWVFHKNMKEMIKCLVNDCGFKFRWIDHGRHIPMMFHRIFETAEYESSPKWKGDIDDEALMWEGGGSRERCRMRAASAYVEQMKML
ncbi:LOW QUALITY PROTEIN: hypothetical protein ACHAXR_004203, partial [Thalassiosira sp. AJA248-18]